MKATITVDMNNAAFDGTPGQELARILRELAHKIERDDFDREGWGDLALFDVNGNRVGQMRLER